MVRNAFICHTPLHLLIAALELSDEKEEFSLIFVMEDARGIHDFAKTLFPTDSTRLVCLPGAADGKRDSLLSSYKLSNSKIIESDILRAQIDNLFVYFDQRPESQTVLNSDAVANMNVVLLEDGVSTYNVAAPFGSAFLKNIISKARFGIDWKGAKWVGDHPAISEVRCFYPTLVRSGLLDKIITPLHNRLDDKYKNRFAGRYEPPSVKEDSAVIVMPYSGSRGGRNKQIDFLCKSICFCERNNIKPIIKMHPRQTIADTSMRQACRRAQVLQQGLPIEMILFFEKNVNFLIGDKTSSLHVTSALHSSVQLLFYDRGSAPDEKKWNEFYRQIGANPIPG